MTYAKILAAVLLLTGAAALSAQIPDWLWATQLGGEEIDKPYSLGHDDTGNVYVAGLFSGTASFGSEALTSYGAKDIYVAKLNPQGQVVWARQAGGTNDDEGLALTVSGSQVWVTGYFMNTASFGTYQLSSQAWRDLFVAKLDLDGNWLGAYGAHNNADLYSMAITCDTGGDVYVTGYFGGTATFGSHTIVGQGGFPDIFVAKLSSGGNWLWALRAGGEYSSEAGLAIGSDYGNNIYVAGYYDGSVTIGPENFSSAGLDDIWVGKLDPGGNWLWARRAGGLHYDRCLALAIDDKSMIYIAGYFSLVVEFGTQSISSAGGRDIFYSILSPGGFWEFTHKAGGAEDDCCTALDLYGGNMVYLSGYFNSTASFGSHQLVSAGYQDVFAALSNNTDSWVWARRGGGSGSDYGNAIAVTGLADIYLGCDIFSTYSSFGETDLVNLGMHDAVIAKLGIQSGIGDETVTPASPGFYALPNPFKQSSRLSCRIAADHSQEFAEVEVYDLKGRLIRQLRAEASSAGELSVVWDGLDSRGDSCPEGVYLVKFGLPGQKPQTGRISLLK